MLTRRLSIIVLSLSLLSPVACGGVKAPVTANPAPTSVQATRQLAIRTADEFRRGLVVARTIRNIAQEQSGAGKPITAAQMVTINQKAIVLGNTVDALLTTLQTLTTEPSLQTTKAAGLAAFTDFTKDLPNAGALTILVQVLLDTFVVTKGGA